MPDRLGISKEVLDRIVYIITSQKEVEKIVIFGSRARGDFSRSSDIDIAIFARNWTYKDINLVKVALDEEIRTPLKFDVVHFYGLQKQELVDEILKEGIVIYGKEA